MGLLNRLILDGITIGKLTSDSCITTGTPVTCPYSHFMPDLGPGVYSCHVCQVLWEQGPMLPTTEYPHNMLMFDRRPTSMKLDFMREVLRSCEVGSLGYYQTLQQIKQLEETLGQKRVRVIRPFPLWKDANHTEQTLIEPGRIVLMPKNRVEAFEREGYITTDLDLWYPSDWEALEL